MLRNYLFTVLPDKLTRQNNEETKESNEWRSLLGSLLDLSYPQACETVLQFVSRHYSISSLAWLKRTGDRLETVFAKGKLHSRQTQFSIMADDERLLDAVKRKTLFELHDWQSSEKTDAPQTIRLFPLAVGSEIPNALIVGDEISSENTKRRISQLCRTVASKLEILRLREELDKSRCLKRAMQRFKDSIKEIADDDNFWLSLVQACAELLQVERSSLLVFDEKSNSLSAKAATGVRADIIKKESEHLGERVAQKVLQNGKPMIIEDVRKTINSAAPVERNYKSNCFISYPIMLSRQKIGVLNLTDRADGENFSELDLEILDEIVPQLAALINSASLKDKAGEFAQLSVTDALTGLLNRLYLDERLPEEIRRSNSEGFPMSFLMIDVDNFKSYNDNFGHAEGDKALKIVARCLKDTMRGADVAARYGGEEFSILLPQTTSDGAATIGERIREKVASTEFPNRQITISVGVASFLNTICTAEEIVKWADNALYKAKRLGRNNVQVHITESEINAYGAERRRTHAKTSVANFPAQQRRKLSNG